MSDDHRSPDDTARDAAAGALQRVDAKRGDATMGRIADLAGGWSVAGGPPGLDAPTPADPAASPALPPPRVSRSAPPPPPVVSRGDAPDRRSAAATPGGPLRSSRDLATPGSAVGARASASPGASPPRESGSAAAKPAMALGASALATIDEDESRDVDLDEPVEETSGEFEIRFTVPDPVEGRSSSSPLPRSRPAATAMPAAQLAAVLAPKATAALASDDRKQPSTPAVSSAPTAVVAAPVPIGEFGHAAPAGRTSSDTAAPRRGGGVSAVVSSVGEARGDATMIDSTHQRSDETELRAAGPQVADAGIAATLRHAPSLPRRRGLWGDLRYVFTAWRGGRRARRELAALELEQIEREKTRRRHLTTIGRAAATSAELDQTQIRRTRDNLVVVDQERSTHASQVGSSDVEMEAVRRDRASKALAHRDEVEALELEQAQLLQKLEPMQRESAAARRRATDLRNALSKLDGRIRNVEAGRGKWADSAAQAAELAAVRAERQMVARDEPIIAAQLDSLVPRIASIEATRERLRRKVIERKEEEEEDRKRSDELLSAIGAKRRVVERATGDAEKARERMLSELGERLYVDRPANLSAHLAPIDSLDLELGAAQRRMMDLREILASVDRWKVARGLIWWTLLLGAIGAAVWFYLQGELPFLPAP